MGACGHPFLSSDWIQPPTPQGAAHPAADSHSVLDCPGEKLMRPEQSCLEVRVGLEMDGAVRCALSSSTE